MDKLELFNKIVKAAKPASREDSQSSTLDEMLGDLGIDSLDAIMLSIYFSEIYGVSEGVSKTLMPATPRQFFEMYEANATSDQKTIDEAIASIKL